MIFSKSCKHETRIYLFVKSFLLKEGVILTQTLLKYKAILTENTVTLLVVSFLVHDFKRSIDLFQQNEPKELMGKSHFGERYLLVSFLVNFFR